MLINKLQSCGLTKSEAQVYLALLQKKEFAASEISSIIPVGRTRIYEIIPLLVAKGLCTEIQKNGKKNYCAVKPKMALKNLIIYQKEELEKFISEKINIIKDVEDELDKIYEDNNEKEDDIDYIEVIKDKNQVKNKWFELQKNTKYELLAFNKAPYASGLKENVSYEENLLKKKRITGKGIYDISDVKPETYDEFIKLLETYTKLGEEVRVIKRLPMKLIIIDESIVMLAMNDPVSMEPSITTVIVAHKSFAEAHREVFDSYWKKAIPLDEFKTNIEKHKEI